MTAIRMLLPLTLFLLVDGCDDPAPAPDPGVSSREVVESSRPYMEISDTEVSLTEGSELVALFQDPEEERLKESCGKDRACWCDRKAEALQIAERKQRLLAKYPDLKGKKIAWVQYVNGERVENVVKASQIMGAKEELLEACSLSEAEWNRRMLSKLTHHRAYHALLGRFTSATRDCDAMRNLHMAGESAGGDGELDALCDRLWDLESALSACRENANRCAELESSLTRHEEALRRVQGARVEGR